MPYNWWYASCPAFGRGSCHHLVIVWMAALRGGFAETVLVLCSEARMLLLSHFVSTIAARESLWGVCDSSKGMLLIELGLTVELQNYLWVALTTYSRPCGFVTVYHICQAGPRGHGLQRQSDGRRGRAARAHGSVQSL